MDKIDLPLSSNFQQVITTGALLITNYACHERVESFCNRFSNLVICAELLLS